MRGTRADRQEASQSDDPIAALLARAELSAGIDSVCATQVALAHRGEVVASATFGRARFGAEERDAGEDTLFAIYSVTKAIVSAASWILLQEGALRLEDRVVDYLPEFGTHGKDVVRVEQLLTHTSGFPTARLPTLDWEDPDRRGAHFAAWQLEWEPGSRFTYHSTASMWVLAALIERVSGVDYRHFVRARITGPLGLSNLHIGLPQGQDHRVPEVVCIGEPMSQETRATSPVDAPVVTLDMLGHANDPVLRAVGDPAGGGLACAVDVARFYQAILADAEGRGPGIWHAEQIRDACSVRSGDFLDPMTQQLALRGLGVVLAGESGGMWRGFCDGCSARAFGHMGAGGQISWADPETGLSFVFLTNAAQQNAAAQGANGLRLSMLAAACAEVLEG